MFNLHGKSVQRVQTKWKQLKSTKKAPDRKTIMNIVNNFDQYESVFNNSKVKSGPKITKSTPENIDKVKNLIMERNKTGRRLSIRKGCQEVDLKPTTYHHILKFDLKMKAYKMSVVQPLTGLSQTKRVDYAEFMKELIDDGDIDPKKVWFTDEAHFYLDGYVNRQNFRIWGTENPHMTVVKPLHPKKVTVWCAMCATGIIGPYFFEDTVNGIRYMEMMKTFFFPKIEQHEKASDYWFMQDGAPPHRKTEVFDCLKEKFQYRLIALNAGPDLLEWPPYSPDLNPCDFFLWGYLKDNLYETPIKDTEDLKLRIKSHIEAIPTTMLSRVVDSFEMRLQEVIDKKGGHIEIFH